MIITSSQNEKIKEIKRLLTDKSHLFLDNPKVIEEAVNAGHTLEYIICNEKFSGKTDYGGELLVVSDNIFRTFSNTKTSQGIVGVIKYNSLSLQNPQSNYLVLDEVQDPGNVGTLLRSALGADFKEVYLVNSCRTTNDKVVRSSMGAVFKLKIYECEKKSFLTAFKNFKIPLYIADMNGKNIYTHKIHTPIGLVLGNEGNGVSSEFRKISKETLSIPMNSQLESLNVGVAGSVIMFQIKNKE